MNTIEEVEVEYELPSGVVLYATVSIPFHNNDPVPDEMTLEYCEINSNGKSIFNCFCLSSSSKHKISTH